MAVMVVGIGVGGGGERGCGWKMLHVPGFSERRVLYSGREVVAIKTCGRQKGSEVI